MLKLFSICKFPNGAVEKQEINMKYELQDGSFVLLFNFFSEIFVDKSAQCMLFY